MFVEQHRRKKRHPQWTCCHQNYRACHACVFKGRNPGGKMGCEKEARDDAKQDLTLLETLELVAITCQCNGRKQKSGTCESQRSNDQRRCILLCKADKDRSGRDGEDSKEQACPHSSSQATGLGYGLLQGRRGGSFVSHSLILSLTIFQNGMCSSN